MRAFEGQGWHPLKVTDFTFTGEDGHQEGASSSKTESDSGNSKNGRVPATTQSSRGHEFDIFKNNLVKMSTKVPPLSVRTD